MKRLVVAVVVRTPAVVLCSQTSSLRLSWLLSSRFGPLPEMLVVLGKFRSHISKLCFSMRRSVLLVVARRKRWLSWSSFLDAWRNRPQQRSAIGRGHGALKAGSLHGSRAEWWRRAIQRLRMPVACLLAFLSGYSECRAVKPNPSIERTSQRPLRAALARRSCRTLGPNMRHRPLPLPEMLARLVSVECVRQRSHCTRMANERSPDVAPVQCRHRLDVHVPSVRRTFSGASTGWLSSERQPRQLKSTLGCPRRWPSREGACAADRFTARLLSPGLLRPSPSQSAKRAWLQGGVCYFRK